MAGLFDIFRAVQQGAQNIPLAVDTIKGIGGSSSGNSGSGGFGSFSGEQSNNNSMLTTQHTLQDAGNQLISVGLSPDYLDDALKLYLESKNIKSPDDLLIIGNGNRDVFVSNVRFDSSTNKIVQTDTKITPEILQDFNSFINAENRSNGFKMSDAIKEAHDSRIAMMQQHTPENVSVPTAGNSGATQYKGR